MEEVQDKLIEIIKQELDKCKQNKTVPSKEVLDTIQTFSLIMTR